MTVPSSYADLPLEGDRRSRSEHSERLETGGGGFETASASASASSTSVEPGSALDRLVADRAGVLAHHRGVPAPVNGDDPSRDGVIVVVRPDQYVANVLPLTATAELAEVVSRYRAAGVGDRAARTVLVATTLSPVDPSAPPA